VPSNGLYNFFSSEMSNDGRYHILGGNQGIIYSDNYGVSYSTLTSSSACVSMNSYGSKLIHALAGGSIYTTDVGSASITTNSGSHQWISVCMSDNGLVILATAHYGKVFVSTDGGANFAPPAGSQIGNTSYWNECVCSATGEQMMVCHYDGGSFGGNGGLFQSIDFGANFTKSSLSGSTWGCSMSSDGVNRLVATDYGHYKSSDSGVSYQKISGSFGTNGLSHYRKVNISSNGIIDRFNIGYGTVGLYSN
jgi:hypothetical protein